MGICCSKAAAGELDDDEGLGFPWMHDDLFHSHLWASAGVSVHTKQGWKGANQDAMTVSQDFAGHKSHIFCGVFDGHGPLGREVARHVRDTLPVKLASALKPKTGDEDSSSDTLKLKPQEDDSNSNSKLKPEEDDSSSNLKLKPEEDESSSNLKLKPEEDDSSNSLKLRTEEDPSSNTDLDSFDKSDSSSSSDDTSDESQLLSTWKNIFVKTFEQVDEELRQHSEIDCICSGTTAVAAVRQGNHLIVANLGDSRAVLCTRDSKDRLIPVQLTTDLKPDLPSELARILNCNGRVFAMDDEPDVPRMWLPDQDAPGLAMARAFGDFCLKNHGLICTPEVYCRKLSEKDEFLVLATDGIWDVLSNKEVVKLVSSASDPSKAARQLIDRAVRAWRRKYPTSMVDDCAVVCLYLNQRSSPGPDENLGVPGTGGDVKPLAVPFTGSSFRRALSNGGGGEASSEEGTVVWRALERVARANSVIRLPRMGRVLSWRRRSSSLDEDDGEERD
ncbi:probable protein phosphatase 2C 73 [Miscanthus floridulus]|uniref:probable protein phosphatase 2C 73 n=1 Tax=Miscanthus floridulus TaxID=154761 RepID=UPI003459D7C5